MLHPCASEFLAYLSGLAVAVVRACSDTQAAAPSRPANRSLTKKVRGTMSIPTIRRLVCLALIVASSAVYASLAEAAKPGTVPAVPLNVTVLPLDSAGNPCRICSDGLGPYMNGVNGVDASIDRYGNLIIDFGGVNQEVRNLRFDYSQPTGANSYATPPVQEDSYLSTITHPGGFIQSMVLGAQQCVQLQIAFVDGDALYHRNVFQRPPGGNATSYLVVTRTDADTWEAEPKDAPCNTAATGGVPLVGRLLTAPNILGPFTDRGTFYLPFKMLLERQ